MLELCKTCFFEYPQGEEHKCYNIVTKEFVINTVLCEFFIQCGLCHKKAALSSLFEGTDESWIRINKATMYRGYLCNDCFNHIK